MARICFVGFERELVPDFEQFLEPVKAPVNYKDQAKIDEYVRQRTAVRESEALEGPLTSRFRKYIVLTSEGSELPLPPAAEATLAERLASYDFVGSLRASELFRLMRLQQISVRGSLGAETAWLRTLDFVPPNAPRLFDPAVQLTGSTASENVDAMLLARRFGLLTQLESFGAVSVSFQRAWLARRLSQFLGY